MTILLPSHPFQFPIAHSPARSLCAAALLLGLLAGTWSPAAHATALQAEAASSAIPVSAKKVITHDVYANWRSIQGSVLSRDGQWAAYALVGQESDGEVVVTNIKEAREWRAPRGTAPVFSADGRYLAFAIQPTRVEIDKAKKDKKKGDDLPKSGLGIMDLATGKFEIIDRVKRFSWPEEGGNFLAVLLEAPKDPKKDGKKEAEAASKDDDDQQAAAGAGASAKKKDTGTEFFLIDVSNGKRHGYKEVTDYAWAKNGELLAFSLGAKEVSKDSAKDSAKESAKEASKDVAKTPEKTIDSAREGVYLISPQDTTARVLMAGIGSYKHLHFDEAGKQLAFVSNRDDLAKKRAEAEKTSKKNTDTEKSDKEITAFNLYMWRTGDNEARAIVTSDTAGLPAGWLPSEHASLSFSKDGQRLFFGTAELPRPEPKDAPEPFKVDLWHWKDPELQSMQKVKAEKEKQRSYKAVFHIADQRFVQLATRAIPNVLVNDNPRFGMGASDVPYKMLQSWDALYHDAYAVDLQTGQARLVAQKLRYVPSLSPGGKYVLAFDASISTWFAWATADGSKINLTGKIKARFEDAKRDTPEVKDAYGFAGWTEDDASVVLYDQFDLWEVNPATQVSHNLTAGYGRKHQLELRYVALDNEKKPPQEEPSPVAEAKALPLESWILAATNEGNRSTGYYQQNPKGGEPQKLIHADKLISGLIKAKKADTVLFTQQSFTEFPDLWASNLNLQTPQKISAANPQQAQYNWGKQELIEYTSADGKKLKALLAKPENFDPSKKYPMMVYIYENMSENLHRYVPPAPGQNINVTRYLSNGYIVLRPDIVYKTGHPGKSAYNTVIPAIQKVLAQGYVDPKRVGIQGHSWGAYQINYLLTQTNMFRAAEAGASMANMISGYGGIRWGTGMSRAFQYEKQQSRIGGAPWNKTAEYIENSPIFFVDKVQTPYLTIHNDDDDAVPWYQAIEFFTALRQLGKEAYWFNFNGEKHGLKERDNMKFYTVHMAEFFDHYLLGSPRPEWMDKPVPYLDRGKRDVMGQFKPVEEKKDAH
ncbi:prolyl oligopeptidase family serine peptidase [Undibacterium sp. TJN19]|uniref:S9 family peptidase n=1 Tax=Undibacterium sp. TJN19 TaxID=3413055 RepID=UPI003BF07F45